MTWSPLISLVVLTYSEKRINDLKDLLKSVERQSYENIELILVVERSQVINQIANEAKSKYPKRVYFARDRIGVSKARNVGVDLAKGEIIAFIDDDAILSKDWSETLVESFRNFPKAIGVTGKAVPMAKLSDLSIFPESLYWAIGCTAPRDLVMRYTSFASGVNMAFRREAFLSHHFMLNILGDSQSRALVYKGLPNDENDFAVRLTSDLQRPILFNPGLVVCHKVYSDRISISFVKRYCFWQGFAEARYQTKPQWKNARTETYAKSIRILFADISSIKGGINSLMRRASFLLIALFYTSLGFLSYRNQNLYDLSQYLL